MNIKYSVWSIVGFLVFFSILFSVYPLPTVYAGPSSSHYQLINYGFGAGGGTGSSTNFQVYGVAGELEYGSLSDTGSFKLGSGLDYLNQAALPPAPALSNPSNYYNRLHIIIDNNGNTSSDSSFAIAISSDDFTTTNYIQSDNTVSTSPVWQSYSGWGGSAGFYVIGLAPNTTYKVRAEAKKGNFTQTGLGPASPGVATSPNQLSFSISPSSVNLGQMSPGNITTGATVTVNLDTNGDFGATVWISDKNSGLLSNSTSHNISSVSNNLTSINEGYGLQGGSTSQTSGGPMALISPYNGAGNSVGVLNSTQALLSNTSYQPVVGGSVTFNLKAKPSSIAPPASDYNDILTLVATADY